MFRTFDHYYDCDEIIISNNYNNNIIENEEVNKECFICCEINTKNEKTPINLIDQSEYLKICYCNGDIHKKCLDKWYKIHKSCPVCRKEMTKNNYYLIKIINHKNFIFMIIFCKKYKNQINLIYSFFKYLCIYFLFFCNMYALIYSINLSYSSQKANKINNSIKYFYIPLNSSNYYYFIND